MPSPAEARVAVLELSIANQALQPRLRSKTANHPSRALGRTRPPGAPLSWPPVSLRNPPLGEISACLPLDRHAAIPSAVRHRAPGPCSQGTRTPCAAAPWLIG